MWRSLLCLLAFFAVPAMASSVRSVNCQAQSGGTICKIQLDGEITAGEKLFIPLAQDADRLFFQEHQLGSTGHVLSSSYAAAFLPRVYSLQPIQGEKSAELTLDSTHFFASSSADPAKIKIIPSDYPLRRVYGKALLKFLGFFVVMLLASFVILRIRRTTIDGWTYPIEELRWFFGSLFVYMLLSSVFSHLPVPAIWSANFHEKCQRLALAVNLWSLSALILGVRFNDRSCVERGIYRRPHPSYSLVSDFALLFALFACISQKTQLHAASLGVQAVPMLLALSLSIRSLEWRRVWKRSGFSPLLFQFTLMASGVAAIILSILVSARVLENPGAFRVFGFLVLLCGAWRMHRFLAAKKRSAELVRECRATLLRHSRGHDRLLALCEFVEDEWAAARVSIISVQGQFGLVIASAGPDAIPESHHPSARKLGPFLRRVCREGHILYAPVAEELGKDLQEQGMKHSSLAMPFSQQGKIGAVLCMMADEGERIPALDATVLELMAEELSLEILSAAAQYVAEKKCDSLMAIARQADGIAVEHMDDWGHLKYADKEEDRFLVGAKIEAVVGHSGASALRKAQSEFNRELLAIWHSLALAFEFVPKEIRDDFWVLSPKEFRQPFLRELGSERAAIALAAAMDKQAKILASKESYLLLAFPPTRIVAGRVKLHLISYGAQTSGGLEIDSRDLETLHRLRERAGASGPLAWGALDFPSNLGFACRKIKLGTEAGFGFWSILSVTADKKETRKIETKALDSARESLKKAS